MKTIYVVYETVYEDGVEYYENAPYPTFAPSYARAYCKTKELAEKWISEYKAKWVEEYEEENENDYTIEPMDLFESEEDVVRFVEV